MKSFCHLEDLKFHFEETNALQIPILRTFVQTFKYRKKKKRVKVLFEVLTFHTFLIIQWLLSAEQMWVYLCRGKNNKNLVFVTFVVNCEFLLSTLLSECVKQSAYERHLSMFIS